MSDPFDVIDNPHNPLDGAEFSAGTGPDLRLRAGEDRARFSLRIKLPHLEKATEAFACLIAAKIGTTSSSGERTALCLGPDEWLLMAPQSQQENIVACFAGLKEQTSHSLVDVGHRTVAIEVSGPAAAMVLNAGCPLDLEAMAISGCTRTILDKVQIVLIKIERDHYQLEIVRSFGEFVWNFLIKAGREFDDDADSSIQAGTSRV